MLFVPMDANLLDDLSIVTTVRGIPQIPALRTTGTDGRKRHGDFAVALVLAYAQTRSGVVEFGYRSASTDAKPRDGGPPDDDEDSRRDWWRPPLGAGLRGGI